MDLRKIPMIEKAEKVSKASALKASAYLPAGKAASECTDEERASAGCAMFEALLGIELDDKSSDRLIENLKKYCEQYHLRKSDGTQVLGRDGKPLADLAFWPSWTAAAAMGALYKRPETMPLYIFSFASALNTCARQDAFKAVFSSGKAKVVKAGKK